MSHQEESASNELERTLDLKVALAIGVGTMVGAGIFVFPGIAAGYAGPAAMLSFALAGGIALLVALSTAELATAMPESGGAYYYVSRTFGPFAGFLIGVGQWIGLVFASAFYLSGFGQYTVDLLAEMGLSPGDPVVLVAFGTALLLTLVNLLGTKKAGKVQNRVVIVLTALLTLLFGYGILNATGLVGTVQMPVPFAPKGIWPIFTTTALIFTSYLGFVQIATVAGEIKEPAKNLPRALVGSVLLVMTLYVIALFVSTSVLPNQRLAELGETAMVDVARSLIGTVGALVVLAAGLLATLSSANASILSSSRAIYALSNDNMLPKKISRVNERFGTPHWALLAVGVPIAGLTMLGRIEILAEVASLLHLVMYGMICVTLLRLRKKAPHWYLPDFKAPAVPLVPAVGALASFGLILLMEPLSIAMGAGVLLVSALWYFTAVPAVEYSPPTPSFVKADLLKPRILLPIEVPDPKPIPTALLQAFNELELFVLGYRLVPEQTSPEQSEAEFSEEEKAKFEEVLDDLRDFDINIETEVAFTPDLAQSLDRHIRDNNCHSILTAKPISSVERLLVPIYSKSQINPNLATILYDLALSSELPVSLAVVTSEEQESEEQEKAEELEDYAVAKLEEVGLGSDRIRSSRVNVNDIAEAVARLSGADDLVILSEAESTDRSSFFNTLHDDIEEAVSCPVLVVLNDRKDEDESG